MASSVSSERAFSAAGITIDKRRNRLKADIVEALQCLKSLLCNQVLFPELPSSLTEEDAFGPGDEDDAYGNNSGTLPGNPQAAGNASEEEIASWDSQLLDGSDADVDDAALPGAEDDEVDVPGLD